MASLHKPNNCNQCNSCVINKEKNPERWVCENGHIIVSRNIKPIHGICRICKKSNTETEFANSGNICKECKSIYHKNYRNNNHNKLKEQHKESYQRDKKKRQAAVRTAIQRSPEAFLRSLWHRIIKRSNQKIKGYITSPITDVNIDYEYLLELLKKQEYKCAITRLSMSHKIGRPDTMSVDRIDSSKGYIINNVQLVCQLVNLGKSDHSQSEVLEFFDRLHELWFGGIVV